MAKNYENLIFYLQAPKIPNVPIEVASFDYMRGNPWKTLYENADLIISHAGAGSCLEALENRRRLLVVINESLMDNHQIELACALKECNYLEYCYPQVRKNFILHIFKEIF